MKASDCILIVNNGKIEESENHDKMRGICGRLF